MKKKHIYVAINLYDLEKFIQEIPKEIYEIINYLKQMKPKRWDYNKILEKMNTNLFEKYKTLLEE